MSSPPLTPTLYPHPAPSHLATQFTNKPLSSLPTPSAVIDLAIASRNCSLMLAAARDLSVAFRAHVKTHKTSELTRLQVGADCQDVRLVVSTVIEAEELLPLLRGYYQEQKAAKINVLYGVPLPASQVERLANVGRVLGPGSIAVMIDHPYQVSLLPKFRVMTGFPATAFVKVDSGTHRAGLRPASQRMIELLDTICTAEKAGDLLFNGYYSHAGHSYAGNSPDDAMGMLKHEIDVCMEASKRAPVHAFGSRPVMISIGASPTALSMQNLQQQGNQDGVIPQSSPKIALDDALKLDKSEYEIELHAGVYPLMDMQQVAASSRSIRIEESHDSIALTILAEVCSLYPEREKPEALIAAGTLALGREPCKGYDGWGVVSAWGVDKALVGDRRIIIERTSQEHGIAAFENGKPGDELPLEIGQKIRIWPNHACIAAAEYGWYAIIDSNSENSEMVKDVWVRWRGW